MGSKIARAGVVSHLAEKLVLLRIAAEVVWGFVQESAMGECRRFVLLLEHRSFFLEGAMGECAEPEEMAHLVF